MATTRIPPHPWIIIVLISIVIIIITLIMFFLTGIEVKENIEDKKGNTNNSNTPSTSYKEVLELIDYGYIGGNKAEWVTPPVNYKFKLRTEGHSFFVQFSTENRGWTKKILISGEEDINIPTPPDAIQGPLKVTKGPNETREFRVQLYKKINIKI